MQEGSRAGVVERLGVQVGLNLEQQRRTADLEPLVAPGEALAPGEQEHGVSPPSLVSLPSRKGSTSPVLSLQRCSGGGRDTSASRCCQSRL